MPWTASSPGTPFKCIRRLYGGSFAIRGIRGTTGEGQHDLQHISEDPLLAPPRARSPWPRRVGIGAAVLLVLAAGAGIGALERTGQLNSANAKVTRLDSQVARLGTQVSSLHGKVLQLQANLATAQYQANKATVIANDKAAATYQGREAQLSQELATVRQKQNQLNQEIGNVQANQISNDGVYVIGQDIKGGVWHTTGGSQCYYATLGSTDTSNILDNNNFNGPETVDLSGAYAFQISGGCTWIKIG